MDEIKNFIKSKNNLINLVVVFVLLFGLPLGVGLVKQQQKITSKAAEDVITVLEGDCVTTREEDGPKVATCPTVDLQLISPYGPPKDTIKPETSPSANPEVSPIASANPSNSPSASSPTLSFIRQPSANRVQDNAAEISFQLNICPASTIINCNNQTDNVSSSCNGGSFVVEIGLNQSTNYTCTVTATDTAGKSVKSSSLDFQTPKKE